MNQTDRGFSVAFAAALLSTAPRAGLKLGAALYSGSRLLSVGANRWHSHPASNNTGFCRSLHAENVALLRRQHFDRPSGRLTLFVARRLADGSIGNSKPCGNCLKLCVEAGISRVRFYEHGVRQELAL
jgi:deoxycytidylate deaminase